MIPCASEKEARFITPDIDVGETIECTSDLLEDILEAEENAPQGALKIAIYDEDDLYTFAENQYAVKDALCLWTDVPELLEQACGSTRAGLLGRHRGAGGGLPPGDGPEIRPGAAVNPVKSPVPKSAKPPKSTPCFWGALFVLCIDGPNPRYGIIGDIKNIRTQDVVPSLDGVSFPVLAFFMKEEGGGQP